MVPRRFEPVSRSYIAESIIQDYDQVIRLRPRNARGYNGRANAKKLSGDIRGAAADRRYARQLKEQ